MSTREPTIGDVDQAVAENVETAAKAAYAHHSASTARAMPWSKLMEPVKEMWRAQGAEDLVVMALAATDYAHRRKTTLTPKILEEWGGLADDRKAAYIDGARESLALVKLYGFHL